MNDDYLKVYDAAMFGKEEKELRASLAERREAGKRRREQRARHRAAMALILAILVMVMGAIVAARMKVENGLEMPTQSQAAPEETAKQTAPPVVVLPAVPPAVEAVTISAGLTEADTAPEEAVDPLLAAGYYSLAVPMPFEYQGYMRTYCAKYGCPYPLALATAEQESTFNIDAVGKLGEVGIMQLNPGPGGSYHAELEQATGLDPTTPEGNIAGGCYLLGTYMQKYDDAAKAAMAYSMGEAGARKAWADGTTSTAYSRAIQEAVERWECTVNAWRGE